MKFIDTHTHLYLEEFDSDRSEMIRRAVNSGVPYMILPDIDSQSVKQLSEACRLYPQNCFPMAGLHPTSVKENYNDEIELIRNRLKNETFFAVGEVGIDLFWDKTFYDQQCDAFRQQLRLALQYDLPIAIHSRNSLNETIGIISEKEFQDIKGVFHCYPGNVQQAEILIKKGYILGIGGVVTYKNSGMAKVVKTFGLDHIVLETDAPFLPPVPFRGQRNESAYILTIAEFIASLLECSVEKVAEITTRNALELFKLPVT
jgi:TatD DNase family protein